MQGINFAIIAKFIPCGSSATRDLIVAQNTYKKATPPSISNHFPIAEHLCTSPSHFGLSTTRLAFLPCSPAPVHCASPSRAPADPSHPLHTARAARLPLLAVVALLRTPPTHRSPSSSSAPQSRALHHNPLLPLVARLSLQPWFVPTEPIVTGLGSSSLPLRETVQAHPGLQLLILRTSL